MKEREWISVKRTVPFSGDILQNNNQYYWINIIGFGVYKAMHISGEWWWNYVAKISGPHGTVTHWMHIEHNEEQAPVGITFNDID